jgi:hypothetical protein
MQDRYAGDVGDFIKLGLLRHLAAPPRLSTAAACQRRRSPARALSPAAEPDAPEPIAPLADVVAVPITAEVADVSRQRPSPCPAPATTAAHPLKRIRVLSILPSQPHSVLMVISKTT